MALPTHRPDIQRMITLHVALMVCVSGCIIVAGPIFDVTILAIMAAIVVSVVGLVTLRTRVSQAIAQPLAEITSVTHAIAEGAVSGRI